LQGNSEGGLGRDGENSVGSPRKEFRSQRGELVVATFGVLRINRVLRILVAEIVQATCEGRNKIRSSALDVANASNLVGLR